MSFDLYMGIDVGLSGGIVVLDADRSVVLVRKMPDTISASLELFSEFTNSNVFCIVENVRSQPKDGAASAFSFGMTIGILHTSLTANKVPFDFAIPRKWQKMYSMSRDKDESQSDWKNRLKERAIQLFPHEKVTLWNADAFLIAEYCRRVNEGLFQG